VADRGGLATATTNGRGAAGGVTDGVAGGVTGDYADGAPDGRQ
jgi:hypothetical protein